jgi:hypothetical protein
MAVQLFPFCKGEISRARHPSIKRLPQPKSQKKNNAKEYTVNCSLAPQTSHWQERDLREEEREEEKAIIRATGQEKGPE